MGLLGPSWDWEEIQKKDAIMGELRKENDRVLKERRKENDRVIKKLNNNNKSYDNSNVSKRSDHSLTADEYARLNDTLEKEKREKERNIKAIIASKNRWNIAKCMWKTMLQELFYLLLFIFLSIITSKISILFVIFMFFTIGIGLICVDDIIRCILLIDNRDIRTIKKARCYQDILNDIKKLNLDEIKYIKINSLAIGVEDFKNKQNEYSYKNYNFPPLPIEKQAIFLGSLIYDLGLNKKLLISQNGSLKAENLKLIAKMEKENKKKELQEKKDKERKINKGETW